MRTSPNRLSFLDRILGKKDQVVVANTFKDERKELEQKAVAHEQSRTVQASKFPNVAISNEQHPGTKTEVNDHDIITEAASKVLKSYLGDLVGRGAFEIDLEEMRVRKSHKDRVDNSDVTDNALVAFATKFALPGINKNKIARFVVSYDIDSDASFKIKGEKRAFKGYNVEAKFYSEDNQEFDLTFANLNKYLDNRETDVNKTATREQPLVWFNPDAANYEIVETKEPAVKIAARLKSCGFAVTENDWMDRCKGPDFGRLCTRIDVPLDRESEFKKIAALSDDEWVNRGAEKSYKGKDVDWADRALEKTGYGYDQKDFKKNDDWVARNEEKGKANPYPNELAILAAGATKVEAAKELTTVEKIEKLEKLIG